jgi:hypothetical protein
MQSNRQSAIKEPRKKTSKMAFKKDRVIYENKQGTKVYIHQCTTPAGRTTKVFAVRRDDNRGLCRYLGGIEFDGGWRQYVFNPDNGTQWSAGCMQKIVDFINELNEEWKAKCLRNWKKQQKGKKTLT